MAGVQKAPLITKHVSFVLRQAGHRVKKVVRVYAPGDPQAYGGNVTVEYVDPDKGAMTAIVWNETKPVKAGVKIAVEKVKVTQGWQGLRSWVPPEEYE